MVRFKVLGIAAVVAAGLTSATAASAAPFGYGFGPPEREVIIERVAGGCGPGFHPNPWGHCRPNGWGWGGGWGGAPRGYGGEYERGGYGPGYGRGPGGPGGYGGPRGGYGSW